MPKSGATVQTDYAHDPVTSRLYSILTQKTGQAPITYQNMSYQFDAKGNLTGLNDTQNAISYTYTYDALDRLRFAVGAGNPGYSDSFASIIR